MQTRTTEAIQEWLVAYMAKLLDMEAGKVDLDTPVERYGLDSAAAIELVSELADWLGVELEPTIVFDHRTIRALAGHVAGNGSAS